MRLSLTMELCKKLLGVFVQHDLPSCNDEDRANQYSDSAGWVQCTRCWLLTASEGGLLEGVEFDIFGTIKLTRKRTTAELLGDYTDLINTLGAEHPRSVRFIEAHRNDREFTELARLAVFLRQKIDRCNSDN